MRRPESFRERRPKHLNGQINHLAAGGASTVRVRSDIPLRRSQASGEPLDVPEAMELLSGMKRQKGQRTRPGQGSPVTGFGWEVAYRAGRRGTDMNGAFDRVTLGPNIYPPDIRGRARWQERPIKGDEERRNHEPMRLERRRRGRYRRSGSSRTIRDACGSTKPTPPRTARMPPVNSWRPPKPTRGTGTE